MVPSCCDFPSAADRQFTAAKAAAELDKYRRGRIEPTTRLLRDGLVDIGLTDGTLLDIGAGVGALTFELLDRGMASAVLVEASTAYATAAREESIHQRRAASVEIIRGDFLSVERTVSSADIVTLDRVICCYPEYEALLERALPHADRALALSYPRDRWYVRAGVWLDNAKRARKSGFRTFVHPPRSMQRIIESAGFALARRRHTVVWTVDIFVKRA